MLSQYMFFQTPQYPTGMHLIDNINHLKHIWINEIT